MDPFKVRSGMTVVVTGEGRVDMVIAQTSPKTVGMDGESSGEPDGSHFVADDADHGASIPSSGRSAVGGLSFTKLR